MCLDEGTTGLGEVGDSRLRDGALRGSCPNRLGGQRPLSAVILPELTAAASFW